MSGVQVHGSVTPPDHKEISGDEAWTGRSSLPTLASWIPQHVKTESNVLQDTSPMPLPSSLCRAEEGEISETQPHNQSSEAYSFLYSIPQWQPPSTQSPTQHHSKRPTSPVPSQQIKSPSVSGQQCSQRPTLPVPPRQTKPPSAHLRGLPPPSQASIRSNKSSFTQPQGPQPRNLGRNEKIPGICKRDILDNRIGIRPRNKESTELQLIKNSRHSCGEKGVGLPRSMKIIIQQFMVANGYVYPHQYLILHGKSELWSSLLVRLDLHKNSKITKETDGEQKLIKSARASIDGYISEQSREWRLQGVFEQISEIARPTFAVFTRSWTNRGWDGSTLDFTRAKMLMTMSPALSGSPDKPKRGSRPTTPETIRGATRQMIVVDDDTIGSLDDSHTKIKPTLKRSGQDCSDNQANKRPRTRDCAPITSKDEYINHIYDGLGTPGFQEKGLPIVIEALHHARNTMMDLAPMSAKDLAVMQQNWKSDGFPSVLPRMLTLGRSYTATMSEYFENALESLPLLEESDQWKACHMQADVGRTFQKGEPAREQSQNERVPEPPIHLNGETELRNPHEREDSMLDRSQARKASDRPTPPSGVINPDRSSPPEGVALDQSKNRSASGPPLVTSEETQVDNQCRLSPAKPYIVENREESDPLEVPNGTAENPYML